MLDVVISESPEKFNKLLYEKYFKDKLADLVVHRNGNFTIQKILSTIKDVTQVIIYLHLIICSILIVEKYLSIVLV